MNLFFRYLIVSGFLLATVNTVAQSSRTTRANFSGTVTNSFTGKPLVNASIYFSDTRMGTTTDSTGSFKLVNLPSGNFLIEVSHVGFKTIILPVLLSGSTIRNFQLVPAIIEREAVTVTGVSSATSVKRTPVPVDIVRREDLMRNTSTNLVDALSRTPGVSQISTGPAVSKPVIRGLGYNRLVVINDGIRQEGQQWGDEHGIEIYEYNVSKAEVLKGPASLMYGSDALAGVVNIISINPVQQGTIKGNLFSTFQTNNLLHGFHGDVGGNRDGLIWGAYASYKAAADYSNRYDGPVFNSRFNERSFGGYMGVNKHWGYSHLYVSNFNQNIGLIEGVRDSATGRLLKPLNILGSAVDVIAEKSKSTQPSIPKQNINHFKVVSENTFNLPKGRLAFTVGYQRNQRKEFGDIVLPTEANLIFDLTSMNYNMQYQFAANKGWRTTIGANGMVQSNRNKGEEVLIPEYNLTDAGLFFYTQKTRDHITYSGGIRLDNRHLESMAYDENGATKFNAFSKNYTNFSGSIGLSYEASKQVTLKLNLARGFRAPSIPELASNGAHEGTNRYEYGSQNLKSEQSIQADAGIEYITEHVSVTGNLFYNHINNFIFYRKLSAMAGGDSIINDGHDDYFAFTFDQQNAALYGAEFNIDLHPHPLDWLHINNTFSYVRGKLSQVLDGSNNLPFIPAARLINELKVDLFKQSNLVSNLYAQLSLDNTFGQNHPFTGYETETATKGYSLLNVGFGGDVLQNKKKIFSLHIAASNVTDIAYQNHLSRLKYTDVNNTTGRQGVFNMGRNFSVKMNVPLNL